jgi:putative PIN family toxin of toxin-antitoxin system
VLDTSVGLSALLFAHGTAARLRHLWQGGRFEPLASSATVAELMRVLAYPKFKLTAQVQHELLADYLPYTTTVTVPEPPPAVPPCRDAHDLPFLHLAVASRARVLVTGDADLLALAGQVRFRISTLADFLAQSER